MRQQMIQKPFALQGPNHFKLTFISSLKQPRYLPNFPFQNPLPFGTCPNETNAELNLTLPVEECEMSSETAYFWYRQTIDASPSIDETGGIKWWMALCLTLSWILVWVCIMKGIQSSGKVSHSVCLFSFCLFVIVK